jgi:hypothetical protein
MDELALSAAKQMNNNEWGIAAYYHLSQSYSQRMKSILPKSCI